MGTRCLTVFKDAEKEIAVLYRQFDGYPEGHGKELTDFLKDKRIVNGIGGNANSTNAFNGMACLAASVVAHFKEDIGGFYLYPAGVRGIGEEYTYEVSGKIGDSQATVIMIDCYEPKNETLLKPKENELASEVEFNGQNN